MKKLIKMLKAVSYQDVCKAICEDVDLTQFEIISRKYYLILKHKSIKSHVPFIAVHTDTIHSHVPEKIVHKNGILTCSNGIGGDDRNGCFIVSELLQSNPKDFIFGIFDLEEHGCVGSNSFIDFEIVPFISCIIGIDRRNSNDLALYGYESDEFLTALDSLYSYKAAYGSCSDCSTLADLMNLCCFNISCGFYNEHTFKEYIIYSDVLMTLSTLQNLPHVFSSKQFEIDFYNDDEEEDWMMNDDQSELIYRKYANGCDSWNI